MEYVNIDSISDDGSLSEDARKKLFSVYDGITPHDHVIATDQLNLVRGRELIDNARANGVQILPLRRAGEIRETNGFPKRVLLELTTACNSDCTMCPRNVLTRKIEHMDADVAKGAIDDIAKVGISGLWLYNIGESLLHPQFYEVLDHCRRYDNLGSIWLSTNGEYLDDEKIEMLLDHPVDILNYSVNAMSEEKYKTISPKLTFDRVQKNIHTLIRRKRERGQSRPLIRAQMIEIPGVMHEIDDFKKEFGDKADILSINQLEGFSQNVPSNNKDDEISLNKRIEKCNRLDREDFIIFADGSVSCCATDFNGEFNLGNIHDMTVQEIYSGEIYQNILHKHKTGRLHEIEICSRCQDFTL